MSFALISLQLIHIHEVFINPEAVEVNMQHIDIDIGPYLPIQNHVERKESKESACSYLQFGKLGGSYCLNLCCFVCRTVIKSQSTVS